MADKGEGAMVLHLNLVFSQSSSSSVTSPSLIYMINVYSFILMSDIHHNNYSTGCMVLSRRVSLDGISCNFHALSWQEAPHLHYSYMNVCRPASTLDTISTLYSIDHFWVIIFN